MTLACLTNQSFCLTKGQDLIITIPVIDTDGQPVNLDTADIVFGIARNSRTEYSLTLTTTTDANVITATLTVLQSETLRPQDYYFSCWVDIGDGQTPVARGTITVESDPRTS